MANQKQTVPYTEEVPPPFAEPHRAAAHRQRAARMEAVAMPPPPAYSQELKRIVKLLLGTHLI